MRINWRPSISEEIEQNVRCLIVTAPGSVPLARDLGTPQDSVDLPESVAGGRLRNDVVTAVRIYEPRAKIRTIAIVGDADGHLTATAELVPA